MVSLFFFFCCCSFSLVGVDETAIIKVTQQKTVIVSGFFDKQKSKDTAAKRKSQRDAKSIAKNHSGKQKPPKEEHQPQKQEHKLSASHESENTSAEISQAKTTRPPIKRPRILENKNAPAEKERSTWGEALWEKLFEE